MTETTSRLRPAEWLLAAAVALLGTALLFDVHAGINGALWVSAAVMATLFARRSSDLSSARPAILLGAAAIITAGAAARTTAVEVHVGIFWLTAVVLAAFLYSIPARDGSEIRFLALLTSPFAAIARVFVTAARETGIAFRAANDSPSKLILRRVILVAPVVIVLLILLGGADPVINSLVTGVAGWLPQITLLGRIIFFCVLLIVMVGACSRLPDLIYGFIPRELSFRSWPSTMDGMVLVGSTLATIVAFLILQVIYLFVRLPNQIGNGVTYADYARSGFGQLCVVVTIVAAVILVAEKSRDSADAAPSRTLRNLELALIVAAGLILLSAQRRVILYEEAYGYTVSRVHATAFIAFLAGFLILLANELRRGSITPALGRRSALLGLTVVLVILYWNDQAWIMNRNIDRIRTTGKFDSKYAASLSDDALPALLLRKNELPPDAWPALAKRVACKDCFDEYAWYEWNVARSAAATAKRNVVSPAGAQSIRNPARGNARGDTLAN